MNLRDEKFYEWFDEKYNGDGKKPTLEDRAELLRGLKIKISDSQLDQMRHYLSDALHRLGQRGNCSPGLTTIAYQLIFSLASSSNVPNSEVKDYIVWYRKVIDQRCPHLKQNFE